MEIHEKQSTQLDEILRHLVNTGKPTDLKTINTELFPDDSYESCLSLFYILKEYYPINERFSSIFNGSNGYASKI